jgi:nucleotide-binding universal stress UspA family protein
MKKEGINCEPHLLVRGLGSGEDIVQYASDNEIDEIVIGVTKTSKVGKLVFDSTAQYIILHADCSVISVR